MTHPNPPFEAVIPVAPKDANKLPFVASRLAFFTDACAVHIITPDPAEIPPLGARLPVEVHTDQEALAFDRMRFAYRPDWVFQQFAKTLSAFPTTDYFLVIDADTLINRRLEFFEDGHPVFYINPDKANIGQYLAFNKALLGYPGPERPSFISEITFYKSEILRELVVSLCGGRYAFVERCAEIITPDCFPAESEWYAAYVMKNHPGLYRSRQMKSVLGGRYGSRYSHQDILDRIEEVGDEGDVLTIHSWEAI